MIASVYTRVYNSVHVGTQLYTHVYTKQHTTRAQKLYLWERGVPPEGIPHPVFILFTIILFTIMTTEEYQRLDLGYIHCAGGDCTLRAQCARHHAYERAQENERAHYTTANLGAIRRQGSCSLYEEGRRQRLAWGISRLYDELRAPDARWIRQVLQSYLGRGAYYHVRQLRRALTPEEQEYIRGLFDERGYGDLPLASTATKRSTPASPASPTAGGEGISPSPQGRVRRQGIIRRQRLLSIPLSSEQGSSVCTCAPSSVLT